MPALERLYTIPVFRAEKSRTRRHLTEFWHAEMEIAWSGNEDVMDHGERLVRHIARTLLNERSYELESLGRDLELIERYASSDYPRIRYDEAIERLKAKGVQVEWGQDLDYSKENTYRRLRCSPLPHALSKNCKTVLPSCQILKTQDMSSVMTLAPEGYGEILEAEKEPGLNPRFWRE